jgi:predicted  nucleic acid-binding Zn-ribbon protein
MNSSSTLGSDVLRTLHRIHRQLTDLRERLDRGPRQIKAHQTNVGRQEEVLAQLQADAKAFRVATDAKQLQFKTNENKSKELKVKLNGAQSNREYQLLKEQIAADEMANSVLADEILEALDKADVFQAQIAEAAAVVAKVKEETAKVAQEVQAREPAVQADIARLEAELETNEVALPDEIRQAYQRLVRQRGEDGLAPITDQPGGIFCGGCNQQMTLNLYNTLRLNKPVFCRSCGRLLYIPEGHDVGPIVSPAD